jgi:hypothetical protein
MMRSRACGPNALMSSAETAARVVYWQQFWAEEKLMRTKSKMGIDKREKQAGRG